MLRVSLCQRNKARRIMTWYARIFDTETKEIRYESLGTTKKTEAHDLMLAKQAEGAFVKSDGNAITLGRAFELYEKSLEEKGCSAYTIGFAHTSLLSLKKLYGYKCTDITKKDVLEAFNEANKDVQNSTYNSKKTYIKTAFKFAVNVLEALPSNPADILKARKCQKRERDFWTNEQIDRILACAPTKEYRLIWAFEAFAGFRIHEALKVKREDVRDGFIYVVGKGNKPAKVPLSSRLKEELDLVNWEWNFNGYTRKNAALGKAVRTALGDEQTGSANNHRFRHSFASNLIRSGVNVKSAQKLLRHSNISTTLQIYSHLIDDDLREDIEKMFGGK